MTKSPKITKFDNLINPKEIWDFEGNFISIYNSVDDYLCFNICFNDKMDWPVLILNVIDNRKGRFKDGRIYYSGFRLLKILMSNGKMGYTGAIPTKKIV